MVTDCKLIPSPEDPVCSFKAKTGPVTLKVDGTIGSVMIIKAEYDGKAIPNLPSSQIQFTVVAGRKNLDVVYVFSDPENGAGVLSEVCTPGGPLASVTADNPMVRYIICA
ncbi:MAG: hypothetical protein DMG65_21465 [Candidatus Angelobacter sp. Gp1-AA117]|nr:MAG: hypothetical protein DMG65_21465 [Candidatus Angelobacter sp. Gp1-AA117]